MVLLLLLTEGFQVRVLAEEPTKRLNLRDILAGAIAPSLLQGALLLQSAKRLAWGTTVLLLR